MARTARVVAPGFPHHVIQRGNRKQPVFFRDDDYRHYIRVMSEWCGRHRVAVWAYCLMENHVHLVLVPETPEGLARAVGEAHRRYTRHINQRKGWTGYLWQGRFASFPMDERYLLAAVRYIELNPVRAGIAGSPLDYRWSSARAHIKGRDDALVRVRPMLEIVGDWRDYLAQPVDRAEEKNIRLHSRTGRPLGSDSFVELLERHLRRLLRKQRPGPTARGRKGR
jgi:putative transposase